MRDCGPMAGIEILRDVPSPLEGFSRTLRIYTPAAYDAEPNARFGVVYLNDGQNVLDHPETATFPSWSTDRALEQAMAARRIGKWMLVGVDSGPGRFEDYSPWPEPRAQVKGRGERYARFLTETLKPFIDARYRTRPDGSSTAVMGSSLGGLISLYLGLSRPHVFGRIGALSPSVMWCQDELFRRWDRRVTPALRVYLDAGTSERLTLGGMDMDYGRAVQAFHRHLESLGYGPDELKLVLEPDAPHHESAWQRRFPGALEWLLREP